MAQRYLRIDVLFKSGLKDQLVFEGFNDSDAQWAADNIDVD
ncbi:MAG: Ltp family lipoprotein [Enterococcus casseliflavus]